MQKITDTLEFIALLQKSVETNSTRFNKQKTDKKLYEYLRWFFKLV